MTHRISAPIPEDERSVYLRNLWSATQSFEEELGHLSDHPENAHSYCMDALLVIELLNNIGNLGLEIPKLGSDSDVNIQLVRELVQTIEQQSRVALQVHGSVEDREVLSREVSRLPMYEISVDDASQIQKLLNELRDIVNGAESIDPEHRSRLLKRLEEMQKELHKHESNLDKFWGVLGDAGAAAGQFGKDIKPLVDRIGEIVKIIRKIQSRGPKTIGKDKPDSLPGPENDYDGDLDV